MLYNVLFLKKFNNYFNRIIKGFKNASDYETAAEDYYYYEKQINFSFADNVSTELVINDCPFEPDYMLLLDLEDNIVSRWFIMEGIYTREGQKNFKLRRDVIYDNIDKLSSSPVFVHKGWLNEEDPFIVNDEGMSFNEIKSDEILLKDRTKTAWVVGYIASNFGSENIKLLLAPETPVNHISLATLAAELGTSEANLASILNIGNTQTNPAYFTNQVKLHWRSKPSPYYFIYDIFDLYLKPDFSGRNNYSNTVGTGTTSELWYSPQSMIEALTQQIIARKTQIVNDMSSIMNRTYFTKSMLSKLQSHAAAETIILYNGVYYKIQIQTSGVQNNSTGEVVYSTLQSLGAAVYAAAQAVSGTQIRNNGPISVSTEDVLAYVQLIPAVIPSSVASLDTVISSSRKKLLDQAYDMFAIPLGKIGLDQRANPADPITNFSDENVAKKIAVEIARELDASCYDIQILPYCPFPELVEDEAIDLRNLTEGEDFDFIKFIDSNNVETIASVIMWAQTNNFSHEIPVSIIQSGSKKINSQCKKYRLCSPNYQGSFDFNIAKNGGSVESFFADCTYKPYTPYIKIAPKFAWLYGTNYGDARGLICGGDFSLPRLSDAWEAYELNNKNYQNIFNREIQHLDFEQGIERRNAIVGGVAGIITGGAAGAGAGAMLGGGWGALAGGITGTAASGVGMGFDMHFLAQQQRENRQYAVDKYNYQLGNIKALPYTLTKVGAFNINSKIWPFLEYYTCSEKEQAALENKIKYESMTIMRIDLFGDYYEKFSERHYFKGELIRNEELAEDNHVFEAIYAELLKGVYI